MSNMMKLLKQAKDFQKNLEKAQKEMENKEVTGTAGDGLVSVVLSLKGDLKSIALDKSIINPDEKEMLEDLVVAAVNNAKAKADEEYSAKMKEASGGMDLSKISGGLF